MKMLFVGGGSLGPVTPLLAVASVLRAHHGVDCIWIGTPNGPEASLIKAERISFLTLPVVKWPRYPSLDWLWFPVRWIRVRAMARRLLEEIRPDGVISMGGFTALPIIKAAARKKIPCFTHQLDYEPGLTNRLIASYCVSVTTSFEYERRPFGDRVCDEPIATPVRFTERELPTRAEAARSFGLNPRRPVVLIYGGGQGAQIVNEHVERKRGEWLKFAQVLHVTGPGKGSGRHKLPEGYVAYELLDRREMLCAHALADLEITRGGIGTLSEIAALQKTALVVPMPNSHQEANARAFEEQGAALVFDQRASSFDEDLLGSAQLLLEDKAEREAMGKRAHAFFQTDNGKALAERVVRHYHKAPYEHPSV